MALGLESRWPTIEKWKSTQRGLPLGFTSSEKDHFASLTEGSSIKKPELTCIYVFKVIVSKVFCFYSQSSRAPSEDLKRPWKPRSKVNGKVKDSVTGQPSHQTISYTPLAIWINIRSRNASTHRDLEHTRTPVSSKEVKDTETIRQTKSGHCPATRNPPLQPRLLQAQKVVGRGGGGFTSQREQGRRDHAPQEKHTLHNRKNRRRRRRTPNNGHADTYRPWPY